MLNHITVMGRMTRDPEARYTRNNTPVCSFTLAVERDRKNEDGSRTTDFIDCVAWRSTAEFISKYFRKGSMAVAAGRLQLRDWTDKDGNKRRQAEILCENVYFGESKSTGGGLDQYGYDNEGQKYGESPFNEIGDEDGELPF